MLEKRSMKNIKHRSVILYMFSLFSAIGYLILNLEFRYDLGFLDLEFTPWRLLTLVLALPLGFSFIVLMFFYESPKFLANQGKNDEALEILTKIYRRNGGNVLQFPVSLKITRPFLFCNFSSFDIHVLYSSQC